MVQKRANAPTSLAKQRSARTSITDRFCSHMTDTLFRKSDGAPATKLLPSATVQTRVNPRIETSLPETHDAFFAVCRCARSGNRELYVWFAAVIR